MQNSWSFGASGFHMKLDTVVLGHGSHGGRVLRRRMMKEIYNLQRGQHQRALYQVGNKFVKGNDIRIPRLQYYNG